MNFNSYLNLSDGISNPITDWLAAHEKDIIHTADYIFHHPELAYQEKESSRCLAAFLEKNGFSRDKPAPPDERMESWQCIHNATACFFQRLMLLWCAKNERRISYGNKRITYGADS